MQRNIIKKLPKWIIGVMLMAGTFLCLFAYIGILNISGNFHTVLAGELYRSGQINALDIARYKKDYGIKTIINLRGENRDSAWYRDEVVAAQGQQLNFINFKMSAKRGLTPEQAQTLINIMAQAPKPILLHCHGGADRSGLAAALYLAGVKKDTEFNSELQMSLYYGHFSIWFLPAYGVNRAFEKLETSLGYFDS